MGVLKKTIGISSKKSLKVFRQGEALVVWSKAEPWTPEKKLGEVTTSPGPRPHIMLPLCRRKKRDGKTPNPKPENLTPTPERKMGKRREKEERKREKGKGKENPSAFLPIRQNIRAYRYRLERFDR